MSVIYAVDILEDYYWWDKKSAPGDGALFYMGKQRDKQLRPENIYLFVYYCPSVHEKHTGSNERW